MKYLIRIEYLGGHLRLLRGKCIEGDYVMSFDPDANDGRGELLTTPSLDQALKFDDQAGALRFYRQASTVHPLRDDGKPNRPLTAFTVTIEPTEVWK
jgi:hypothetical protein